MKLMKGLGVSLRNVCAVVIVASLTSGCIMYRLEELRNAAPSGNAFQTELSRLYMDFATRGEEEYDWFNSWHFADKGLMLAYGKDAGPEDLNNWDIPEDALPDLEKAREKLVSVLTPKNMHDAPSRTSAAQFYFDCWVKYQEPNWQQDEIAFCRDHFMQALESLGVKMPHAAKQKKATAVTPEAKPEAKPEANVGPPVATALVPSSVSPVAPEATSLKPIVAPVAKELAKEVPDKLLAHASDKALDNAAAVSYAVFFEAGKAQLSLPGQNVISEVVDSLKHDRNYEVILHTAATKEMSETLATQRAQLVKSRLLESGIDEKVVRVSSLSQDTTRDTANAHRVDIFLNE